MKTPLIISFPVIEAPRNMGGVKGRVILLRMQPIQPAFAWMAPTMCKVDGMHETGRMCQFTIPIVDWQRAIRAAITFVETDTLRAPTATLGESCNPASDPPKIAT